MSLKDSWKSVGKDFGKLGKDLGKSVVKTVSVGAQAVADWADGDESQEKKEDNGEKNA